MEGFFSLKTFLRLLAGAIVLASAIVLIDERIENSKPVQCAQEVEVTRIVAQTVLVTRIVDQVITAAPQPTVTPSSTQQSTETPTLTPTLQVFGVVEDGVSIWCLPKTSYETDSILVTGQIPQDAVPAEYNNGNLTVTTQMKSCTFMVAFNSPVPAGVRLKIQDLGPQPFIDAQLKPLESDTTVAYTVIDHYFIVDPPYWEVTYIVSIYGPENEKLWEKPVIFKRDWIPEPCPNGLLPDALTFQCES